MSVERRLSSYDAPRLTSLQRPCVRGAATLQLRRTDRPLKSGQTINPPHIKKAVGASRTSDSRLLFASKPSTGLSWRPPFTVRMLMRRKVSRVPRAGSRES